MTHKLNGNLPRFEDIDESELAEYDARALKELSVSADPEAWSDISEINAKNWRDYDDIVTNSLWIIGARSRDGVHSGQYHGNFVPQIPYQAIRRFTKPGDVVLDTFLGSGTTLIESRRLGRHGIGVELVDSIAQGATNLIEAEANPHHTWQEVIAGSSTDNATIDQIRDTLKRRGRDNVQLLRGRAGTGKTSMMLETVEAIEAAGSKVFTFAPSAETIMAGQVGEVDAESLRQAMDFVNDERARLLRTVSNGLDVLLVETVSATRKATTE